MTSYAHQHSRPRVRRLFWALAALGTAALSACGGQEAANSFHAVEEQELYFSDDARLEAPEFLSPGLGTTPFNLCVDEVPREAADLNQAAWMSYFATNEYAHFGYLGPVMKRLGFVNPAGGDLDWRQCAVDLKALKKTGSDNAGGPCADRWRAERLVFPDKAHSPADLFTTWLVRTPKDYNYVEFISGAPWSVKGNPGNGQSVVKRFKRGTTQLMVARHPAKNAIVISFRGTSDWYDVLADLQFRKVDLETDEMKERGWGEGWGQMHGGFFKAYMSVDAQLAALGTLLQIENARPRIYLTGHSLGAALATVVASRLLQANEVLAKAGEPTLDLRGLYTFGSPRVGTVAFAERLEALARDQDVTLARFRNGADTITNHPQGSFEHVGRMWLLSEATPGSAADDSFVRTFVQPSQEPKWAGAPTDHPSGGFRFELGASPEEDIWSPAPSGYYRRILERYRSGGFEESPSFEDEGRRRLLNRCPDPREAARAD